MILSKRIFFILFSFISLTSITSTVFAKEMVAIMDFDNKAQHGGYRVGQGASDMLATELIKLEKFRVMERDKISTVMKEQNFTNSSAVDPSTALQLGKLLGVKYIVTGAVTEYGQSSSGGGGGGVHVGKKGYHAAVDVRIIDATTGEIVFAENGEGDKTSMNVSVFGFGGGESWNEKHASEAMREAITAVSQKIIKANLAEHSKAAAAPKGPAQVADVDGSTVTLNQGTNGGFKVGQELSISRKGKEIKDPSTGKVLKVKYDKIGTIKLTNVDASYSEGKIVNGSNFAVGDMVK